MVLVAALEQQGRSLSCCSGGRCGLFFQLLLWLSGEVVIVGRPRVQGRLTALAVPAMTA